MRPLTTDEITLWKECSKLRICKIDNGNYQGNITPLDYILSGRMKELKKMIAQKKNG